MNSLADPGMIELLHRAADAGVEIDLIVRGICCFRPRPKQDNVRIYSIVDRFLEHTRIFYFENLGEGEYYLSSADWMSRNLDRRLEIFFPVQREENRAKLRKLFAFELNDQLKMRTLNSKGIYQSKRNANPASRSQQNIYNLFAAEARQQEKESVLKVFSSSDHKD